jgi:hypothetical protein
MPEDPRMIIDLETLRARLGEQRTGELVTYAKELHLAGKSPDEIALALRQRFRELDEWLPKLIIFALGR